MFKKPIPKEIYAILDSEFGFTLDPWCTTETQECKLGFQQDLGFDGLKLSWKGHRVFLNLLGIEEGSFTLMEKAYQECVKNGVTSVIYTELVGEEDCLDIFDHFLLRPDGIIKQLRFVPESKDIVIIFSSLKANHVNKEHESGLAS